MWIFGTRNDYEAKPLSGVEVILDQKVVIDEQEVVIEERGVEALCFQSAKTDTDDNEIDPNTLTIEETVKRIQNCSVDKTGFDIFQVAAFLHNNPNYGSYWSAVMRCVLSLLTQLPGLFYVIYEVVGEGISERGGWCVAVQSSNRQGLRYFGSCLASFIAMRMWTTYNDTVNGGMYCVEMVRFKNLPDFLSGSWLFLGVAYNSACLIMAVWASMLVIFFSTKVFDMVLNCGALFFLLQMDDLFVRPKDYKMIETFLERSLHKGKRIKDSSRSSCWSRFATGMHAAVSSVALVTLVGVFVAPCVIFHCI